uniref:Uncharacterized protein n=1 Tax=Candidatus Kentrum sp. LFY TaxID=2126342 RepID=A0A450UBB4_9GAMM|nr:MAG: hypothetical protein BECKLFY1418B_GA0070995_10163 [Candidatus Kentron sp. LFY]
MKNKPFICLLLLMVSIWPCSHSMANIGEKTIIYAGFGNISGDKGQPFFTSVYGKKEKDRKKRKRQEKLEDSINNEIHKKVSQLEFSFPSSIQGEVRTTSDRITGDEGIYLLVLVSTLEINPVIATHSSLGSLYVNEFITGVTALLVEPGTGHIVSAINEIGFATYKDTKPISDSKRGEMFVLAYTKTATSALDRLAGLPLTEEKEWKMVTNVRVEASKVATLFDYRNRPVDYKKIYSTSEIIFPRNPCRSDSCAKLRALLAQGISDRLSRKGHNMLPPFPITAWGEKAYQKAKIAIQIKESGRKKEGLLRVNVSPRSAEKAIEVTIPRFAEKDFGKGRISKHAYLAWVEVEWGEFDL